MEAIDKINLQIIKLNAEILAIDMNIKLISIVLSIHMLFFSMVISMVTPLGLLFLLPCIYYVNEWIVHDGFVRNNELSNI